jgi:putative translation initiation factor aIF-2 beta subunit
MEEIYDTNFLVERLFQKLEGKVTKKKFALKRPVVSEINRKTYIRNFVDICQCMNREPNHFKSFIEKELNIDSSLNEDNILILDNRFLPAKVEEAVAKYAKKFVICLEPKCGSGDTEMIRKDKITYLVCHTCCSKKSLNE